MPSALKSVLTPGIGGSEVTILAATSVPAVTATLVGVLLANNGDGGGQHVTVRMQRGAAYTNIIKNAPLPLGDTFVPSGFEGKIVLMPGDNLRASVDAGTIDATVSYLEQTP